MKPSELYEALHALIGERVGVIADRSRRADLPVERRDLVENSVHFSNERCTRLQRLRLSCANGR